MRSLRKWYVFYTYPKFEKKVHDCLIKENYESFLPMHWIVRQWSDRKKRLYVPLFPNYIFVKIEQKRIWEILSIPKIISCVKFNSKPAFIKQQDVDNIVQIVNTNDTIGICYGLKPGDSVVITKGVLTGMKGLLVEERGRYRFSIQIESLQQSLLVNVPSVYLELNEVLV